MRVIAEGPWRVVRPGESLSSWKRRGKRRTESPAGSPRSRSRFHSRHPLRH